MAGNNMMQSPELQIMTPLLRFMQLLCENHNTILQVSVGSCLFVCLFVCLFLIVVVTPHWKQFLGEKCGLWSIQVSFCTHNSSLEGAMELKFVAFCSS